MSVAKEFQPARSSAVFYRAPSQPYPVAVSAKGMTITDATGKAYLDMSGGAAVSCLGHGHPDVIAAIQQQVETLAFAHTAFFTNEPQEELASLVAARFSEPGARVYFASGGSEANETALKIAWQYWAARGHPNKKIIIGRDHSYHGNTFGVLSASGNDARRRASAAPLVNWPRIPPCYAYRERRNEEPIEVYSARAAAYLDDAIRRAGADKVAAFICEPIVGSSFAFEVTDEAWVKESGKRIRQIRGVKLYDVGPVTYPAYEATSTGIRSLIDATDLEAIKAKADALDARLAEIAARAAKVSLG